VLGRRSSATRTQAGDFAKAQRMRSPLQLALELDDPFDSCLRIAAADRAADAGS
jgi:hypothetical protein